MAAPARPTSECIRTPRRETYGGDRCLLPEVDHLGWTRPRTAGEHGLAPHRHRGWEFCLLLRGTVDWWVEGIPCTVPAGWCYATRPGELHGGINGVLQPCELFWIQVADGRLPGLAAEDAALLTRTLASLPRSFPALPELALAWRALLTEHRRPDPIARPAARALLHRLLALLVRSAQAAPPPPSPAIARACAAAREHLAEGAGVPLLARCAGLSPSRLHDRFRAELGCSPGEWLRAQRLALARRLLAEGHGVTDAALSAGYPSSQYLAGVFRRSVGLSPSAFARAARMPT